MQQMTGPGIWCGREQGQALTKDSKVAQYRIAPVIFVIVIH